MTHKQSSAQHVLLHSALVKEFAAYNSLNKRINEFDEKFSHLPESEFMIMKFQEFKLSISEYRLKLVLLAHALLESTINYIFAQKLSSQEYAVFEKISFIDKWLVFPKFLFEKYNIDKTGQVYELLNLLNRARNSIAHSKPMVIIDDDVIHKGNNHDFGSKDQESNFFLRLKSLPTILMEEYCKFDICHEAKFILEDFKNHVSI